MIQSLSHHFFFFNDTATTKIYTLSLYDALPISVAGAEEIDEEGRPAERGDHAHRQLRGGHDVPRQGVGDRKSTRLNSSHQIISYAVFCLKKKNKFLALVFTHQSFNVIYRPKYES